MELECSQDIVEIYSNIKFHNKYVHWEPSYFIVTDRRKERHDKS